MLPTMQEKLLEEAEKKKEEAIEQEDVVVVSTFSEERSTVIESAISILSIESTATEMQLSPVDAVAEPVVTEPLEKDVIPEIEGVSSKAETKVAIESEIEVVAVVMERNEASENAVTSSSSLGFRASLYQGFQAALNSLGFKPETSEIEEESETDRLRRRVAELEEEVQDLKSRVADKDVTR